MAIDIEAMYRKYGPMVLRRCRFLLKDEERALDAMQDVFVNVVKNQEQLTATYPSSLLYTMATNTCLNILRSQKRHPETEDEEVLLNIACTDNTLEHLAFSDLIDRLFRQERSSTREMLVMLHVDKMTLEETAIAVGLSVSGVRKRVREFKARAQAQKEYTHDLENS